MTRRTRLGVFACDLVASGDSAMPADPGALTLRDLAAANAATVDHVTALLRDRGAGPARLGLGTRWAGR